MRGDKRWSIWIDVEGFSSLYELDETRALLAIGWLMDAIYAIGITRYVGSPERLFAHQFGDGFVVVSDFQEESACRPISIAIALMRHLISRGIACKAAVSCGGLSDVVDCYSTRVIENTKCHHVVRIGDGLMTINPVMGTALVASHRLSGHGKGAVLLLQEDCFASMPAELCVSSRNPVVIDWVHSESSTAAEISKVAGLSYPAGAPLEALLRDYVSTTGLGAGVEWANSTLNANGLRAPSTR